METSCGLVIRDKDGKILLGHPGGASRHIRALPKGHIDPGESAFDCACRETYEETNVDVRDIPIEYFERLESTFTKNGKKKLIFWLLDLSKLPNYRYEAIKSIPLKCNSFYSPGKPEMDIVEYDYPGKWQFYFSQNAVLEQLINF